MSTLPHWNAVRIPARESLEHDIAELGLYPVRKRTHKPRMEFKVCLLQIDNWKMDSNVERKG